MAAPAAAKLPAFGLRENAAACRRGDKPADGFRFERFVLRILFSTENILMDLENERAEEQLTGC